MTTFKEFQSLRNYVDDLSASFDVWMDYPAGGYVYDDLGYIEATSDGKYYVVAERSEIITESLDEAEQWLYDNWVKYL